MSENEKAGAKPAGTLTRRPTPSVRPPCREP